MLVNLSVAGSNCSEHTEPQIATVSEFEGIWIIGSNNLKLRTPKNVCSGNTGLKTLNSGNFTEGCYGSHDFKYFF